jgi:hypothetical protein
MTNFPNPTLCRKPGPRVMVAFRPYHVRLFCVFSIQAEIPKYSLNPIIRNSNSLCRCSLEMGLQCHAFCMSHVLESK